ncbi:hypothetical protein I7I51_03194 [Histoplasma capsulatum]|uniref:Uncharacterized protein n=1 Tax=Ajellomyces capsulatus TaxID=5037 RepID=A0A8A1MQM7_AJECA|nr:hypothetical protein I7I51_03194 [Histoplasma capsulatum]
MSTPLPSTDTEYVDENRRREFLEWLNTAKSEPTKYKGLFHYTDPELRDRLDKLLGDIYEPGFKRWVLKLEGRCSLVSPEGHGEMIVLSGQPKIGSGPVLTVGSINKITDADVISPPMQCVHIYAYKRKGNDNAQPGGD